MFGLDDKEGWGRFVLSRYYGNTGGSSHRSNIEGALQNINKLNTDFILTYVSNQVVSNGSLVRLNKNYSSITQTHNFTSPS